MNIYVDTYLSKNLGDDLFLDILVKRYPDIRFTVNYYGDKYDAFFHKYDNLTKSKYSFFYRVLNRVKLYDYINDANRISKEYDAYIFLGGSIFREEEPYWKSLFNQRMNIVELFNEKNKPVFVLGANFGPFHTTEFRKKYLSFFERCTDVCFRDSYSKNCFSGLTSIRVESDIIFQYRMKNKFHKEKIIGFSVIDPEHKAGLKDYREEYVNSIVDSINHYIKHEYKCILFSFCENEGDKRICFDIYKKVNLKKYISIFCYTGDISSFIDRIQECEVIISSRFHANILGLLAGSKIIPYIYSDKTRNVLNDIGFEKNIYTIKKSEDFLQAVKENKKIYISFNKLNMLRESSERQFSKLDDFIMKKRG